MKKIKLSKIGLALSLVLTVTTSQAQWATFNISDALYDYFRSMRDYVQNSNLQVISNGQQLQMAQAAQNVVNSDYRNRLSTVYNNILQEDEKARPTYQLCAEISKGQVGVSSVAASVNGGRSPKANPSGRPKNQDANPTKDYAPADPVAIQENIRSTENAQAMVLYNIQNALTCSPRYGTKLCSDGAAEYALADVSVFGLLSNSAKADKTNATLDFANYTMNPAAYKAGQQYINVATLANAPKYPNSADVAKNPGYVAMYNAIIIKLNAAGESLKAMLDLRKAPTVSNSAIEEVWSSSDNNADWRTVFPTMKKPTSPSFYEYLNAKVMFDVFGPKTITAASSGSDSETLKGIQSKIAMSNLIGWQQYNQQEKTNILLSHILVQLTTPMQKDVIDREYQKFDQK